MDLNSINKEASSNPKQFKNKLETDPKFYSEIMDLYEKEYHNTFISLINLHNNFPEPSKNNKGRSLLKDLIFKVYVSNYSIYRLGYTKTEISIDRLIIDDHSIASIARSILEISILIRFIYVNKKKSVNSRNFKLAVWEFCDLHHMKRTYLESDENNKRIEKLLGKITNSESYISLNNEEQKLVRNGNWQHYLNYYKDELVKYGFSENFNKAYSYLSAFIHSNFSTISNNRDRITSFQFMLGITAEAIKEIFISLYSIDKQILLSIDLEFPNQVKKWIKDRETE